MTMTRLRRQDFEKLLEFRVTLRRFQRWSEDQARAAGLTHVQHQLLVAIKGHRGDQPPTVGDLAGYLLLRPHSTVELVDRAEAAGLVMRTPDGGDGRVIRVRLTAEGDRVMQELTRAHLERLHELAAVLDELVNHRGDSCRQQSVLASRRGGSNPVRFSADATEDADGHL
jgi:DNA-binding MarR family transcriptional regulator